MKIIKLLFAYFLVLGYVRTVRTHFITDVTDWLVDTSTSMYYSVERTSCSYIRCCRREWKSDDFFDLDAVLRRNVFGQNIMIDIIVPALRGHLMLGSSPSKALTISFHGRPGIGKNYVANYIQDVLFHTDYKNSHVHFFTGRLHFPLEHHAADYRINLSRWIKGNVTKCEKSLFIFDEVDKMPSGVLDAVTPFIDHHSNIEGVDYRKAIFIFISNTGGDVIAKQYLKYWKAGKRRDKLRLRDFEDAIRIGAFNEKGGLYRSETIESSLIDHYVPFLPLEEIHVRKCIANEFKKRSEMASEHLVQEILEDLTFGPEGTPVFSNSGCKRIASKVAAIIERKHFLQFRTEL